jgi:hypothetical protein
MAVLSGLDLIMRVGAFITVTGTEIAGDLSTITVGTENESATGIVITNTGRGKFS